MIIFAVVILVFLLGVVALYLLHFYGLVNVFQTNTTLVLTCESWNCQDPVPLALYELCHDATNCEYYCRNKLGAKMINCH
jgi:hypothetical protein